MRKVCNFGKDGESIWQQADEGCYDKLFCIKDSEGNVVEAGDLGLLENLVPTLKTFTEKDDNGNVLRLNDLEEVDWTDITGLSYVPDGFYFIDSCPKEVLQSFGLIDKEPDKDVVNPIQEPYKTSSEPTPVVFELDEEEESKREDVRTEDSNKTKVQKLIHLRGTQTHRLGCIDTKIEKVKEELQNSLDELTNEQNKVLEIIDTYDKTLDILLSKGE